MAGKHSIEATTGRAWCTSVIAMAVVAATRVRKCSRRGLGLEELHRGSISVKIGTNRLLAINASGVHVTHLASQPQYFSISIVHVMACCS